MTGAEDGKARARVSRNANSLLRASAISGVLVAVGLVLWALSIVWTLTSFCPQSMIGDGLGQIGAKHEVSLWPPAAQCVGDGRETYWFEVHPWMWDAALALIGAAAIVLLVGLLTDAWARRSAPPSATDAEARG